MIIDERLRLQVFCVFFSGLYGWTNHPGYLRPDSVRPDMVECALDALGMLAVTERLFREREDAPSVT